MREHSDVVVVVPFFFCADPARADITRRVFESLEGLTVIGIGSEGDLSRDLFCEHHPADRYREYVQDWAVPNGGGSAGLRAKFDYGIQQARPYNPRTVFLLGSDDFMLDDEGLPTADYFAPSDADLVVATGGVYQWRDGTRQCHYYEHPCPSGLLHTGGAMGFSRGYLNQIDWSPYQTPHCEQGAERLALKSGGTVEERPNACLTVRCRSVLNSPAAMQSRWKGKRVAATQFKWLLERQPKPRDVSVIIPYAGDCPYRKAALGWVTERYEQLGWEVIIGYGDADNWCKAEAVADGLRRASHDRLVIADADVWADDIEEATSSYEPWMVPHRYVHRLKEQPSAEVLEGEEPHSKMRHTRGRYIGVTGGGVLVIDRALYEQIPLDPRFVGWGGEDHAWGYALTTLAGPQEPLAGDLWHLWHPKQPSQTLGSQMTAENENLRKRYRQARRDPDAMRALLDEVTDAESVQARP